MISVYECPCKDCVAPKRHSGCHSVCPEYRDWNTLHQQEVSKVREARAMTSDFDAIMVQKSIKRMKRRNR
jgi:hypothetical protein